MKRCVWISISIFIVLLFILFAIFGKRTTFGKSIGLVEVKGIIKSSEEVIKNLNKCKKNPNIRAVVISINSPGGTVVPCQEMYKAIKELQKPTVASLGISAASGGYYVACACDRIVSNPGTMTGSIGVIMELPNVAELIKKLGVKFNVIKSKPHKDIGSPYREMTPGEKQLLKGVVDDVYNQFVDAVIEGRKLPRNKVLEIADGRILSGRQALKLGLVDTLGTLHDAKLIAGALAGIPGEPKIITFRRPRPLLTRLLKGIIEEKQEIKLEYR
ncbi:signal peptide peptidase SppA [candidate division WOR-3 bacterium]|nr:signal peptide peptidase SppA [candidate division WOR-3 bacterium]